MLNNVTRFGQISPLWSILKVVGISLFSIGENYNPTLAILFASVQIFLIVTGSIESILLHTEGTPTMPR